MLYVNYSNRLYESLYELLDDLNIPRHTYSFNRIKRTYASNKNIHSILKESYESIRDKAIHVIYKGVEYKNIEDLIQQLGIEPYSKYHYQLFHLLQNGGTVEDFIYRTKQKEQAYSLWMKLKTIQKFKVYDKVFQDINHLVEHYGLVESNLRKHILNGETLRDAIPKSAKYKYTLHEIKDTSGRQFVTLHEMLAYHGIKTNTFCNRFLRANKTLQEILQYNIITHEGQMFISQHQLTRHIKTQQKKVPTKTGV